MGLRLLALLSVVLFLGLALTGVSPEVAFLRAAIVFMASMFIYRLYLAMAGVVRGNAEEEKEESEEEAAETDQQPGSEATQAGEEGATDQDVESTGDELGAEPEMESESFEGSFPGESSSSTKTETEPSEAAEPDMNVPQPDKDEEEEKEEPANDETSEVKSTDERLRDEVEEMAGAPEAAEVVREIMEERNQEKRDRQHSQRKKQEEEEY